MATENDRMPWCQALGGSDARPERGGDRRLRIADRVDSLGIGRIDTQHIVEHVSVLDEVSDQVTDREIRTRRGSAQVPGAAGT